MPLRIVHLEGVSDYRSRRSPQESERVEGVLRRNGRILDALSNQGQNSALSDSPTDEPLSNGIPIEGRRIERPDGTEVLCFVTDCLEHLPYSERYQIPDPKSRI